MITIKTPEEQDKMRLAGRLAAQVLDMIAPHVQPGVATEELDRLCHDYIVNEIGVDSGALELPRVGRHDAVPKSICTSVNHVVCHGIPSDRTLRNGDIVNIDVTVIKDGYHGDTSRMFMVGTPSIQASRLSEGVFRRDVARHSRDPAGRATSATSATRSRPSSRSSASRWSASTAATASAETFHEDPQVLHYGKPGTREELCPA